MIVAYDNDEPGQKSAAKLCSLPGFPSGCGISSKKILTEYYQSTGNIDDVTRWLLEQAGLSIYQKMT